MKNSRYTIRLAQKNEYETLRLFLKKHWGENHVLVKNKMIFDFQHLVGDVYNVVIAYNNFSNEIDAFWGIITTSIYDDGLLSNGDCWGAVVKVREDIKNEEIGSISIKMLRWILKQSQFRNFNHSGLGPKGKAFLAPYCATSGPLKQYYIVNNGINEYKIAEKPVIKKYHDDGFELKRVELDELTFLPSSTYKPVKTLTYIENRYRKHPFYKYFAWQITKDGDVKSIWILRKITLPEMGSVLRVVDVIGNVEDLGCIGCQIQEHLKTESCEYVDFLNFGINPEVFKKMGFEELDVDGETIIPQYFEPFERRNVVIYGGLDSDNQGYVIFKGDGDQDRPNIL